MGSGCNRRRHRARTVGRLDEALRIAAAFTWAATGDIDVRAICAMQAVHSRGGAPESDLSVPLEAVVTSGNTVVNVKTA
ncbi:hypothetical protein XpopCFBP1817_12250 [Xanthomonas populi]|uniref:Uncharacterized protein n=2 Tax=Xanthomonas populi TaxID=53414 RepID=A0A2S7EMY7_9XANT|nr:hypothetical protein XpopCFBP1817_12250 [Xanthomonas populi]